MTPEQWVQRRSLARVQGPHDGVKRKDGKPRCMARYTSGARCPRKATAAGICAKCLGRGVSAAPPEGKQDAR